jgi:hypothetical protein
MMQTGTTGRMPGVLANRGRHIAGAATQKVSGFFTFY